jgi:hypothetical protein
MHMHNPTHEDIQRGKTNPTILRMQTNKGEKQAQKMAHRLQI